MRGHVAPPIVNDPIPDLRQPPPTNSSHGTGPEGGIFRVNIRRQSNPPSKSISGTHRRKTHPTSSGQNTDLGGGIALRRGLSVLVTPLAGGG